MESFVSNFQDCTDEVKVYPSEMTKSFTDGKYPKSRIPAERIGRPEDIAGAILYLTSRAGAYCNGNILITDGGRLSVLPASY